MYHDIVIIWYWFIFRQKSSYKVLLVHYKKRLTSCGKEVNIWSLVYKIKVVHYNCEVTVVYKLNFVHSSYYYFTWFHNNVLFPQFNKRCSNVPIVEQNKHLLLFSDPTVFNKSFAAYTRCSRNNGVHFGRWLFWNIYIWRNSEIS